MLWQHNGHHHSHTWTIRASPTTSSSSSPPSPPSDSCTSPSHLSLTHTHTRQCATSTSEHFDNEHAAPLLQHPASSPPLSASRSTSKPCLSLWCAFYSSFVIVLLAACLLATLLVVPNRLIGCESQLAAAADAASLSTPFTHLSHFEAALVQHCLGWGTDLTLPASSSLIASPALLTSALTCQLSPASVMSTFFPHLHALYPSVTTHRPPFSCHSGLYLVLDWPYRDGMGNSMWSYTLGVGVAMALNATLVHDWFSATHDQEEGNMQRDGHFRFGEWEVSREEWNRCGLNTSVKQNQHTIDTMYEEWRWHSEGLHQTRDWIRQKQYELTAQANLTHLGASTTATASYRFLNFTSATSLSAAYTSLSLPAVIHESPGITLHVKAFQSHQDWGYEPGVFAPSLAVAEVLEARYVAQQDEWRRRVQHDESGQQRLSRLATETIAVAIPVRRGDITLGTQGSELTIPLDLRMRVMTDAAIVQILNQTLTLVRHIQPHSIPYNSSSFTSALTSALSGPQILDSMRFTIYSEGSAAGFTHLIDTLIALGVPRSHIQLSLNGRASVVFSLLTESDVLYMAPSSYSYAAACYFNSESVKIGSGWTYSRFAGCRNMVYAPWRRYLPRGIKKGEKVLSSSAISREQDWHVEDESSFVERIVRLAERKREQRRRLEPIVLDNYSERYPITWTYHTKAQQPFELTDD